VQATVILFLMEHWEVFSRGVLRTLWCCLPPSVSYTEAATGARATALCDLSCLRCAGRRSVFSRHVGSSYPFLSLSCSLLWQPQSTVQLPVVNIDLATGLVVRELSVLLPG